MEYIILGLLILKSRSLYELRDRIHKGLQFMYSSSTGSIQAALRKLLQNGCIEFEEKTENGKYKKIYSITEKGRQYFGEWVNSPMKAGGNKDPELAKLYFMGMSDRGSRAARLETYVNTLQEVYGQLQFIYEQGKNVKVTGEGQDIINFQLLSAKYGADNLKFHLDWYTNLLEEIKEGKW